MSLLGALLWQALGALPPVAHPSELARVRDSLEAAQLRFVHEWRGVFASVERARWDEYRRRNPRDEAGGLSVANVFITCDPAAKSALMWVPMAHHVVASATSRFVGCPSWPIREREWYDASMAMDAGLAPAMRAPMQAKRAALATAFARASLAHPTSWWFSGNAVRLHGENLAWDDALAAARQCGTSPSWCAALEGYVLSFVGDPAAADARFLDALTTMPAAERCAWTDVGELLDSAGQAAYRAQPCPQREALDAVIWWLADPLWSEPGNARRAEHFARQVALRVRTRVPVNETVDWHDAMGGDAIRRIVLRYGWWARRIGFGGSEQGDDKSSLGFLIYPHIRSSTGTFEYAPGQAHTMPAWAAVESPFTAAAEAWEVSDPGTPPYTLPSGVEGARARAMLSTLNRMGAWWPHEFYRPRVPLVQLPAGQVAQWRRDTTAVIAVATPLAAEPLGRAAGAAVQAVMLASTGPDDIRTVGGGSAIVGDALRLAGHVPPEPTMLGVEFPGDSARGEAAGRLRFGVPAAGSLRTLGRAATALSDVVLLTPDARAPDPVGTAAVVAQMAPTLTFGVAEPLRVYWETYGIAAADTIEVGIRLERYTAQGAARRLGIRLGVATDQNVPVSTVWRGPAGLGAVALPIGTVPVLGRTQGVDVRRVPPGEYWLDVFVRTADGTEHTARRTITIGAGR